MEDYKSQYEAPQSCWSLCNISGIYKKWTSNTKTVNIKSNSEETRKQTCEIIRGNPVSSTQKAGQNTMQ